MSLLPNPFEFGVHSVTAPDEAAAAVRQDDAAVDISDIGQIFVGARKLNLPRFMLDVEQFMADIEEPPLFLRQAG